MSGRTGDDNAAGRLGEGSSVPARGKFGMLSRTRGSSLRAPGAARFVQRLSDDPARIVLSRIKSSPVLGAHRFGGPSPRRIDLGTEQAGELAELLRVVGAAAVGR
ncbi:hypothetical protein [Brevibacterium sp. 1718]|uniref:hypothetical protein n=1 Tax=Brevibacterium sp. 1718 TaxID=3413510 RepID=UPI003DA8E03E